MTEQPKNSGALEGLTVIDLTQMLAGPFTTMMMADHGANVIKVEPPGGEITRQIGPFADDDSLKDFGGYFQSINRNKRGIVLDLKTPKGKAVLERLVADADVLVENYRSGVMDRLGLSYESLQRINPRLVYAAVRGFGDPRTGESPLVDWPAYDVVSQAVGGIMGITGPDTETPIKIGPGVGDIVPAMWAAFGVLAAVRHAERTGEGQFIDVAMCDGILAICERVVYQYSYNHQVPLPEGNAHPLLAPYGMFPASDGWVTIACPTNVFWELLCSLMGQPELAGDERYLENERRIANKELLYDVVAKWTGQHSKKELTVILGGKVPFGPVQNIADIAESAHFAARDMLVKLDQPGSSQEFQVANTPVRMAGTPGGVRRRAPLLGEHGEDILREAGYSADQISDLKECRAVG